MVWNDMVVGMPCVGQQADGLVQTRCQVGGAVALHF